MTTARLFKGLLATALMFSLAGIAHAKAEFADPKADVDATYKRILEATAKAPDQATLLTEVATHMDGLLDYDAFAKRTLKTTWPTLDEAQRARFVESFKKLIIKTYAKRFKPKTNFEVSYRGETVIKGEKRDKAVVKTTVAGKKAAADVDYSFALTDKGWRAYDITIDDVSMSLNWRRQFEKIVKKSGFDALLAKIDKKVAKATSQE